MTQCVVDVSRLLEWYIRKRPNAKNPAILQEFRRYRVNLVKCSAHAIGQNLEIECFSGFLGNARIPQEPPVRIV